MLYFNLNSKYEMSLPCSFHTFAFKYNSIHETIKNFHFDPFFLLVPTDSPMQPSGRSDR